MTIEQIQTPLKRANVVALGRREREKNRVGHTRENEELPLFAPALPPLSYFLRLSSPQLHVLGPFVSTTRVVVCVVYVALGAAKPLIL